MFVAGIMISLGLLVANLAIFGLNKGKGKVDSNVIIIISSIAAGCIGLPLLLFLGFHIYLQVVGKSTR